MSYHSFFEKKLFSKRGVSLAIVTPLFAIAIWIAAPVLAATGLVPENLTGALTPTDLANQLVGAGISVSNVTYTGADVAAGRFSGGVGIVGFESGIILSSGDIIYIVGPNVQDGITKVNSTPGDPDLDTLSGFTTMDATVLEFDFVPQESFVSFRYLFASDEYNEFVNTSFNDVFGFFINGVNCAEVNGAPVSINTINNGNPFGTDPKSNFNLYVNNDLSDGGGFIDTEMDGLTVPLTCIAPVNAGVTNHIKLAIADASDPNLDSNVFLQTGSFTSETPTFVELISFTAESSAEGIKLVWETASEVDNEGFNLWRSETPDGSYLKINPGLIPAQGNANSGASYSYLDTNVVKGTTYYYRLEDIDTTNGSSFHQLSVQITFAQSQMTQIYLPLIIK